MDRRQKATAGQISAPRGGKEATTGARLGLPYSSAYCFKEETERRLIVVKIIAN